LPCNIAHDILLKAMVFLFLDTLLKPTNVAQAYTAASVSAAILPPWTAIWENKEKQYDI
ncbi:hypothetical protein ACJX0J_033578, partial [Zea mays]